MTVNKFLSTKTIIISVLAIIVIIVAGVTAFYMSLEKQYCDVNTGSIKSEILDKPNLLLNGDRVTEETSKKFSIGDKFTLTNTYTKACKRATKASGSEAVIYSALRYDNNIVGEFKTSIIGDDLSRAENSSFEKFDKLKDSQLYKTEGQVSSSTIKLVGGDFDFSYLPNKKEQVYVLLEVDGEIRYVWREKLEWKSSDNGKTWQFTGK